MSTPAVTAAGEDGQSQQQEQQRHQQHGALEVSPSSSPVTIPTLTLTSTGSIAPWWTSSTAATAAATTATPTTATATAAAILAGTATTATCSTKHDDDVDFGDEANTPETNRRSASAAAAIAAAPVAGAAAVTIRLDAAEEQLFGILRAVVVAYNRQSGGDDSSGTTMTNTTTKSNATTPPLPPTRRLVVRVAGGWVRDKILGLATTHDVDVTANCLSGVQLAELVQAHVRQQHEQHQQQQQQEEVELRQRQQQQHQHDSTAAAVLSDATVAAPPPLPSLCGTMGVIQANPAQSKHLETATMRVAGLDVDFCNLRGDVYPEDGLSRIPVTHFGTALEDAMRRDFTCNALFYNLSTGDVEDYTGRGYADLQSGRLVTPLDPRATFIDDPLRVLRAVRFAVRYGWAVDPAVVAAAQHPAVRTALAVKVSRPRLGTELEGMLSGKNARPVVALTMLAEWNLTTAVFCVPVAGYQCAALTGTVAGVPYSHSESLHGDVAPQILCERGWDESQRLLALLPRVLESHAAAVAALSAPPSASVVNSRLLPVVVVLLPFRHLICTELPKSSHATTTKQLSAVTLMVRECVKFKNSDVQAVATLVDAVDGMADFLLGTANGVPANRLEAGLLVRNAKELWVTALLLATVLQLGRQQQQQQRDVVATHATDWRRVGNAAYTAIVRLSLDGCWQGRPLLDGKAIIAALRLPRGPAVGAYMELQARWMLQHPDGTRDDCLAHLQQQMVVQQQQQQLRKRENGATDVVGELDESGSSPPIAPTPLGGTNDSATDVGHGTKKVPVESMDLSG